MSARYSSKLKSNNDNSNSEFDPLISPHEYADGIDATLGKKKQSPQSTSSNTPDDDVHFDPLLSPHAYPKGTGTNNSNNSDNSKNNIPNNNEEDWTPFQMKSVKNDFTGASEQEYGVQKSHFTREWSLTINSTPKTTSTSTETTTSDNNSVANFDPLISPHAYPNGVDAGSVDLSLQQQKKKQMIGIILIDHGSKRTKSNERLEQIAQLYQSRLSDDYIVKAAHMEIASPSIKDTLFELVRDQEVSKIVCHPYFLSPGRHVMEDIPELIQEAVEEVKADVNLVEKLAHDLQVLLTDPIGSRLDSMVDLISSIVDESLGIHDDDNGSNNNGKDPYKLGGFFAEIKEMMDEQL